MMAHCKKQEPPCVGYIQLVFFDTAGNEVVVLGSAGFITQEEDTSAWANIPAFAGQSNFMADRLDANYDIIDDKPVSVETCERLMGQPISHLIAQGRRKLASELAGYKQQQEERAVAA